MAFVIPSDLNRAPSWPTHRDLSAFCADAGIPLSRFGVIVAGDPRLIFDMRRGRELRFKSREKIHAFIVNYVMGDA